MEKRKWESCAAQALLAQRLREWRVWTKPDVARCQSKAGSRKPSTKASRRGGFVAIGWLWPRSRRVPQRVVWPENGPGWTTQAGRVSRRRISSLQSVQEAERRSSLDPMGSEAEVLQGFSVFDPAVRGLSLRSLPPPSASPHPSQPGFVLGIHPGA